MPSRRAPPPSARPPHLSAARALAAGLPLAALTEIASLEDPHARALRGIALAQLGEYAAARSLLETAAADFARHAMPLERARALAAAGEAAAAERDLRAASRLLTRAVSALRRAGDSRNAAWALLVHARVAALRGAERAARSLLGAARLAGTAAKADPTLRAAFALADAEARLRRLDAAGAARSLGRRPTGGARGPVPALLAEIAALSDALGQAAAIARDPRRMETLALSPLELARVLAGNSARLDAFLRSRRALLVDRIAERVLFGGSRGADLRRKPVLRALLDRLAEAWPEPVAWRDVARDVFGLDIDGHDDSLRHRARVEVERLRRLLPRGVRVVAERNAWRLAPPRGAAIAILEVSPRESAVGLEGLLLALLADGAAWSAADLADASGTSASTVRRALGALVHRGAVAKDGLARACRYTARAPEGIASRMWLAGLLRPGRA